MTLQENIQEWIKIDNEIKSLNSKIKSLRDVRQPIHSNIIEHIETEELLDAVVKISDGKLKFVNQKQTPPLTLKYIEQCLKDTLDNEKMVNAIMIHIKDSRDSKQITNIKRFYD